MTRSTPTPRFIGSSYWGKWSLVLTERFQLDSAGRPRPGSTGRTVEIDLEPVNGWDRADASTVAKTVAINVRLHSTARDKRDLRANELPEHVRYELAMHLGADLAVWLLDPATEILGIIDWSRYDAFCNGGASLRDIVRPQFAHLIPEIVESELIANANEAVRRAA